MKKNIFLLSLTSIFNSIVCSEQVFADLIIDPSREPIQETIAEELTPLNLNFQYLIILAIVLIVVIFSIIFLNRMKNN